MTDNLPIPNSSNQSVSGLKSECLSFPEIIAQSVANVAPTATPAINIALVFASAGNSTWLGFIIASIGTVFIGLCINQFASRSASPGSLYSYVAMGLGSTLGVLSGWSLLLAYLFTGMVVQTAFSNFTNVVLSNIGIEFSPLFLFAICAGTGWYFAYKNIELSTKLMLILEVISLGLIFLVFAIFFLKNGFTIDMEQLTLKDTKPNMMIVGLVLAFFSYVGFESATSLGEEAKKPLKNIPYAVFLTPIICGFLFVSASYIEVLAFRNSSTPLEQSHAPLNDIATMSGVGFLGMIITLAILVNVFSCIIASINAGGRILFTMARHGIFHDAIGQAHSNNKTPHVAITMLSIFMFIVPASMSLFGLKILDIMTYMATMATYGFLLTYVLVAVAAPVYLYKQGNLKIFDILVGVFAVSFMLIPIVGSLYPVPPYPFNVFPYLFLMYLLVGVAWFVILRLTSPEIIDNMEDELEKIHLKFSELKKI
ncbi:MAG TPA: APC family permease [Leptolyngbyaceae cyanobacterium]